MLNPSDVEVHTISHPVVNCSAIERLQMAFTCMSFLDQCAWDCKLNKKDLSMYLNARVLTGEMPVARCALQ